MDKFKNIEKSFESQQKLLEKDADKQTRYNQEETTDDSLGILKLVKHMPNTEIKNNFDIFKDIRIPNSQLNEENQEKREDDNMLIMVVVIKMEYIFNLYQIIMFLLKLFLKIY